MVLSGAENQLPCLNIHTPIWEERGADFGGKTCLHENMVVFFVGREAGKCHLVHMPFGGVLWERG